MADQAAYDDWVKSALDFDPASAPAGAPEGAVAGGGGDVTPAGGAAAGNLDAPPLAATDGTVFFGRNATDLTASDKAALQSYVDRYVQAATPTPITLDGYASVDGDANANSKLAQARADAVKAFMAATIKAELITATGHGPTAQWPDGSAAANRRVNFGPPVAAPAKPPARDGGAPAPAPGGDGGSGDGGTPQKVSGKCDPAPTLPMTDKQFTDIFGADLLAQWNAFRSKGGPVPPAAQLTLQVSLKANIEQDKGNLKIDWLDAPSIAVQFNSSGVAANDQEAVNLVKFHWENTFLRHPIELSVQALSQNLFTSGASPGVGGQPQVKVGGKTVGVVLGGQFMLGDSDGGKFGLNATGFVGLDVTAF